MNQDPVKLQEIGWRRPLNEAEQAELRAGLANHPEAQADVEVDLRLTAALAKAPNAPLPSNFNARVLQAIERETVREKREAVAHRPSRWRILLPRIAVATVVVISGVLAYQHNSSVQRQEMASTAREVASAQSLSDPTVIADFEVIASLSPTDMVADENLLALSDDLMALSK